MSGGRMVWNELNYDGATRKDEDKSSIQKRVKSYLNNLNDSTASNYKCTKYSMTSNFISGSSQRTLYENEYFSIDSNTLGLNLIHVSFSDNTNQASNTMDVSLYFSNLPFI